MRSALTVTAPDVDPSVVAALLGEALTLRESHSGAVRMAEQRRETARELARAAAITREEHAKARPSMRREGASLEGAPADLVEAVQRSNAAARQLDEAQGRVSMAGARWGAARELLDRLGPALRGIGHEALARDVRAVTGGQVSGVGSMNRGASA